MYTDSPILVKEFGRATVFCIIMQARVSIESKVKIIPEIPH